MKEMWKIAERKGYLREWRSDKRVKVREREMGEGKKL